MLTTKRLIFAALFLPLFFSGCSKTENENTSPCGSGVAFPGTRNFRMGFSTWSYGTDAPAVEATYQFIAENADVYSEQIDYKIPWDSWINGTALPQEFTGSIDYKVAMKPVNHQLLLSVSLLNMDRDELLEDYDGSIPSYTSLSDPVIEDAYFEHLNYLIGRFEPDYVVLAMEVNEILKNVPSKWEGYKTLMQTIRNRVKDAYPSLILSESITLHNWLDPDVTDPETFVEEIDAYVQNLDFAAISYYPYFKGQHSPGDFQVAFDFLHSHTTKPIAFVETAHLAEDLSVPNLNVFIESNLCEQKDYLETLLTNARNHDYEFIIWWTFRDFDQLWETFPEEVKDIGQLWRDTGLLDEKGQERPSYAIWKSILQK